MRGAALMIGLLALALPVRAQAPLDGKAVFARNCAACHQAGGTGIPGAFPALKANAYVQGDAALVIGTVLKGRAGMPAFAASLDDAQLAAVLSYVRGGWGNQAGAVTAEQVAAVRGAANAPARAQEKATIIH